MPLAGATTYLDAISGYVDVAQSAMEKAVGGFVEDIAVAGIVDNSADASMLRTLFMECLGCLSFRSGYCRRRRW